MLRFLYHKLQIEEKPDNVLNGEVVLEVTPTAASKNGYVNNAFEDGAQNADKVNDKHNVHTLY